MVKKPFLHIAFHKCAVASIVATFLVSVVSAAEVHPIEGELRRNFPSVAIESTATFEPAGTLVRGTLTSGLRPRFAPAVKSEIALRTASPGVPMPEQSSASGEHALRVLYPRSYDGLLVVVFLAEPVAVLLEVALLLALQSGAGLGPLCLIAVLGTLAKEFFVLLVPVALVVGPRPMLPRVRTAAVLFAVALGTAFVLRWWWTPHLPAPLPAASPGTFLLALHRFHDSFPEWWASALLAGVAPLAVLGSLRAAAAPVRSVALYVVALALIPPFLNPVTFFSSDVPRLLIYTLPVAIPLAVCALMAPDSRAPRPDWSRRRGVGVTAAVLGVMAALAPLAIVDRYRRADLTGPRDGPYVLVVARETLRTARRLSRGEEVVLDPAERRYAWGDSHPSEMDRMRWFLREGWGERAHYGTSEVTMHEESASVLLPVLSPGDLTAALHVQAPRPLVVDASINGRPLRSWAVGPDSAPETIEVPGGALFRGDNLLTLAARDGESGARLRGIVYRGAIPQGE